MVWGAVIAAGVSLASSASAKNKANKQSAADQRKMDEWMAKYEASLDELEELQIESNLITQSMNEASLAKGRRDLARQTESAFAQTQASAYIGGVDSGSSMQGFTGGFSLDTATAYSDMTSRFNMSVLQGNIAQEESRLSRQAQSQADMANRYGAAATFNQQKASQMQSQMYAQGANLIGSVAGYAWGSK